MRCEPSLQLQCGIDSQVAWSSSQVRQSWVSPPQPGTHAQSGVAPHSSRSTISEHVDPNAWHAPADKKQTRLAPTGPSHSSRDRSAQPFDVHPPLRLQPGTVRQSVSSLYPAQVLVLVTHLHLVSSKPHPPRMPDPVSTPIPEKTKTAITRRGMCPSHFPNAPFRQLPTWQS